MSNSDSSNFLPQLSLAGFFLSLPYLPSYMSFEVGSAFFLGLYGNLGGAGLLILPLPLPFLPLPPRLPILVCSDLSHLKKASAPSS